MTKINKLLRTAETLGNMLRSKIEDIISNCAYYPEPTFSGALWEKVTVVFSTQKPVTNIVYLSISHNHKKSYVFKFLFPY